MPKNVDVENDLMDRAEELESIPAEQLTKRQLGRLKNKKNLAKKSEETPDSMEIDGKLEGKDGDDKLPEPKRTKSDAGMDES